MPDISFAWLPEIERIVRYDILWRSKAQIGSCTPWLTVYSVEGVVDILVEGLYTPDMQTELAELSLDIHL